MILQLARIVHIAMMKKLCALVTSVTALQDLYGYNRMAKKLSAETDHNKTIKCNSLPQNTIFNIIHNLFLSLLIYIYLMTSYRMLAVLYAGRKVLFLSLLLTITTSI